MSERREPRNLSKDLILRARAADERGDFRRVIVACTLQSLERYRIVLSCGHQMLCHRLHPNEGRPPHGTAFPWRIEKSSAGEARWNIIGSRTGPDEALITDVLIGTVALPGAPGQQGYVSPGDEALVNAAQIKNAPF